MRAVQFIFIAIQAVSLVGATIYGLPGESNGTVGYVLVNRSDFTASEIAQLDALNSKSRRDHAKRSSNECIPDYYKATALVGNGSPHQNQRFQQVTGNIGCSGAGNSVSYQTSTTISYSVSAGVANAWISGGFSVEESWTQGAEYSMACQAWDTEICVFEAVTLTAYTVVNQHCSVGCGMTRQCVDSGKHFVMFSPNSNQYGGCFLKGANNRINCGNEVGHCPGKGQGFLKACGPVGGPSGSIYCPNYAGQTYQCHVPCK